MHLAEVVAPVARVGLGDPRTWCEGQLYPFMLGGFMLEVSPFSRPLYLQHHRTYDLTFKPSFCVCSWVTACGTEHRLCDGTFNRDY